MFIGRTGGRAEAEIGAIARGILEQNEGRENPMFAELDSPADTVKGVEKRWKAAVAALLMLAAVAYEEPKPSHESQPKTPAGETTRHDSGAFLDS